jgi:hypothetical protein
LGLLNFEDLLVFCRWCCLGHWLYVDWCC